MENPPSIFDGFDQDIPLAERYAVLRDDDNVSRNKERRQKMIYFLLGCVSANFYDVLTVEEIETLASGLSIIQEIKFGKKKESELPANFQGIFNRVSRRRNWSASSVLGANQDTVSIECLLDVLGTGALFEHIADHPLWSSFSNKDAIGFEFGSGSSILSIAAIMAAERVGMRLTMHCYERLQPAIDAARYMVQKIGIENSIVFYKANITDRQMYHSMSHIITQCQAPVRAILTETFNNRTPQPILEDSGISWRYDGRPITLREINNTTATIDPFPWVITNIMLRNRHVIDAVQAGECFCFPNFTHDNIRFQQGGNCATVKLEGFTTHVPLGQIAKTAFPGYPNLLDEGRFSSVIEKRDRFIREKDAIQRRKINERRAKEKKNRKDK